MLSADPAYESMVATAAARSLARRLSATDADVLLSEFLMKAGAWEMRQRPDVKALGCHMAVFSRLLGCEAFGVLNVCTLCHASP